MTPNEQKLHAIVAQTLGLRAGEVSQDSSMDTHAVWDSLKQLNIVLALEEAFDVSFDEKTALEMTSIPLIQSALRDLNVSI